MRTFSAQDAVQNALGIIWLVVLLLNWLGLIPVASCDADERGNRVTSGLAALYTLDASQSDMSAIRDTSGQVEPLDMRIDKPQAIVFRPGKLNLASPVTIASDGPASRLILTLKQSQALTVEAWLTPQSVQQSGPARIVSLSLDTSQRNFTLGQEKGRLDFRLRTTARDSNGIPSTSSPKDVVATKLTHVTCTRNRQGVIQLFIDGQLLVTSQVEGTFDNWCEDCRLVIGNEVTGDRPWLGELYLVAIYSRALEPSEVAQNYSAGVPRPVDFAAMLPPANPDKADFVQHIQPIFRKHCYECHSADKEDGGLNLGIRRRAIEGGDHGSVWIEGNSAESRLIHFVAGINNETVMPPDSEGLSRDEIALLRAWIDQGAMWPNGIDIPDPRFEQAKSHFAFKPLRPIAEPKIVNDRWPRNPIDRFILARLESSGITPAPQAEAIQLIRRVTLDLVGLPPSPTDVAEFCTATEKDTDQAYEALIDRLLSSSHYGERWGRHWLDVARYADSDGQESDRDRPNAYHYRDFVIQAFNNDMPYDQFVRWQLAGDEYEPENPEAVAAVGFLSAGPFAALPNRLMEDERLRQRYNELDDIVSTVGTGLLGLTLGCVRCHDHKYDAIPARDYYSMLSAFHGGERGDVEVGPGKTKVFTYRDLTPEPATTWLFQRGNFYDRDQPVSLSFISIMTGKRSPEEYWEAARQESPSKSSTKQRRALAQWMTDTKHGAGPLLARVIVNRIWMHHLGQGLVRTAGDFGVRADPPSHPELLEWLTHDFVANGWQIKRLNRLILTSSVFRQSSSAPLQTSDPDNRLLWRMPIQRLEGEVLRDAILSASGTLNLAVFGPAIRPPVAAEAMLARNVQDKYPEKIPDGPEQRRRSIYLFHKRVVPYPFLQAFDKPDAQQSCSRRDRTTVTPQALALLNEPFVRTLSCDFADRLIKTQEDNSKIVEAGYQLALSRLPNNDERDWALKFIREQIKQRQDRQTELPAENVRQQAIADFCQVLFSLNEFSYVD